MFKRITLVLASLVLLGSSALASDDLLSELASTKGANISDATVEVEDFDLNIDVDALAENADGEETDAIEACFRRFGYRGWGRGYRSWGYGYRCFRPYYSCYSYYRPYFCRPIYNYCAPIANYWGCY